MPAVAPLWQVHDWQCKTDPSWKDLEVAASTSGLPMVVKGITRAEDAVAALKAGAALVQVSNHGEGALDGTPASFTVLPRIADAMQGSAPIIMDSDIRRGRTLRRLWPSLTAVVAAA
jgi:lactate oxidase